MVMVVVRQLVREIGKVNGLTATSTGQGFFKTKKENFGKKSDTMVKR